MLWARSIKNLARLGQFRHVSTGSLSGEVLVEYRVFSKDDVQTFVNITSDENKIHIDDAIAQKSGFRGAIVPGILSASLFPAAISKRYPGAVYMSQTLKFRHPALVCVHHLNFAVVSLTTKETCLQVGERLKAEVLLDKSRGKHMSFLTMCKIDDTLSPSNGAIVVDGTAMARIE